MLRSLIANCRDIVARRFASVAPERAKQPAFGVFKKKLDAIFANPSLLPTLPYNITEQDMQSIGNDPQVRHFLTLHHQDTQGPQFRQALRLFAIHQFARFRNDTGSPEVQIALSTVRMVLLQRHLEEGGGVHHKDFKTERALKQAGEERKKMLKYLRRVSLERFYVMLDRLGLPTTFIEQSETRYPFNYRTPKKEFKMPTNRTVRKTLD